MYRDSPLRWDHMSHNLPYCHYALNTCMMFFSIHFDLCNNFHLTNIAIMLDITCCRITYGMIVYYLNDHHLQLLKKNHFRHSTTFSISLKLISTSCFSKGLFLWPCVQTHWFHPVLHYMHNCMGHNYSAGWFENLNYQYGTSELETLQYWLIWLLKFVIIVQCDFF